jgi:murein DD-endopeptidase MepM/ murein hydrolase activator NlpD
VLAIGVPIAVVGFGLLAAASSAEDADGSLDEGIVVWPLPDWPPDTVQEWRTGARTFGAPRSSSSSGSHVHAGVDLGPPKVGEPGRAYGARVLSPVAGRVELVGGGWDGAEAKRIEIVSPVYGRIVLGAVQKKAEVAEGELVRAGQLVGWVGRYPGGSTMLHLEQHAGPRVRWATGAPQPDGLIDPRKGVLKAYV